MNQTSFVCKEKWVIETLLAFSHELDTLPPNEILNREIARREKATIRGLK